MVLVLNPKVSSLPFSIFCTKIICIFAAMSNGTVIFKVIYKGPEQVWDTLATENVFVPSEASSYYSVQPETFKPHFN